jgi:hypothetical protein
MPREKRRAVNACHSYSPRAHHPSHLHCAMLVVVALPCSVVEEVYTLVISPYAIFYKYGVFLTSPSMNFTLLLNQVLALVSHGLCISQVVMMFSDCVLVVCKLWFPVVVVLRLLAF